MGDTLSFTCVVCVCCAQIYFSGFSEEQREKLNKIVNLGGGTRYVQDHTSPGTVSEYKLQCPKFDFRLSAVSLLLRFNQLNATLSHVVMGKQEPSEVKTIRELGHWYGGRGCSQI